MQCGIMWSFAIWETYYMGNHIESISSLKSKLSREKLIKGNQKLHNATNELGLGLGYTAGIMDSSRTKTPE